MENNEKNIFKDEFCIKSKLELPDFENEINEEYTLPDYLPDIKRILGVRARLRNSKAFTDEKRLETEGELVFSVIYTTETGKLRNIIYSCDYSNGSNNEKVSKDTELSFEAKVKNVSCRSVSPRKVSLKAKIITCFDAYTKLCISPKLVGSTGIEDEFTLERQTESIKTLNICNFENDDIRISEDIELDSSMPSLNEIICCDADIFVTECKLQSGMVILKANARLTCLGISGDDENEVYVVAEKTVPINRTLECDIKSDGWECIALLDCGVIETGISQNSYGENKVIELDFNCKAKISAYRNEDTVFTKDVYSTDYEYTNNYRTLKSHTFLRGYSAVFTVKNTVPYETGEKPGKLIYTDANCELTETDYKDGIIKLKGNCFVRAITQAGDNGYDGKEMVIPFDYEFASGDKTECDFSCHVSVDSLRVRLEKDGYETEIELGVSGNAIENKEMQAVDIVSIDKSKPQNNKMSYPYILYYPDQNESKWDVAKKYGIKRNELEELPGDTKVFLIKK